MKFSAAPFSKQTDGPIVRYFQSVALAYGLIFFTTNSLEKRTIMMPPEQKRK